MSRDKPVFGRAGGALPLAHEGWPFILVLLGVLGVLLWFRWWIPSVFAAVLLALTINFFRDPERMPPEQEGVFLAPADGRVVRAEASGSGSRVDIFMNVFNVHVNRAPMAGRIAHMQYFPGRFINASFDKASEHNERNRIEMKTEGGEHFVFTQIAGLLARRIVSYVAVGDCLGAGQRTGMIRFGSRVDCEIPAGFALCVEPGQRVRAGETILAAKSD